MKENRDIRDIHITMQADCANCFGLCCVALPFAVSSDFAINKEAGQPCPNLQENFRCGIHSGLRERGFRGCTVFDCFGAGQKVSQVTFGGRDWREAPETAQQMFEVLPVMRQLHELIRYLCEALTWQQIGELQGELQQLLEETELYADLDAAALLELDVAAHRAKVNARLLKASECVRANLPPLKEAGGRAESPGHCGPGRSGRGKKAGITVGPGANLRGADLIGAKLQGADLRNASLRGALLIAAELGGADLRGADLIGADLRDTELGAADLTGCLFLTQSQLNAAKGDAATKLPPLLHHPEHWQRQVRSVKR